MADECCQQKSFELSKLSQRQSKVLWAVLVVNGVMFVVELVAGIRASSLSLTGDSLDMLGDAMAYGSSLYVINKGRKSQAAAALLKGTIMFASAIAVFARATYQLFQDSTPELALMSVVGLLALAANIVCLLLLTRHRRDNLNMSSVWLCSRNDLIANTAVLAAAVLVWLTQSPLPDLIVGILITLVFARSAGTVLTQAWQQFAQPN